MDQVIVVTNFSGPSRNALDFTCHLLRGSQCEVLLLSIYHFSAGLSSDGVAMAAMAETLAADNEALLQELDRARAMYPGIRIRGELVSGVFMEELRGRVQDVGADLVILGAQGTYSELMSWDAHIIDAFVDLEVPVLIVPGQVSYRPIRKIAFACNYYRKNLHAPVKRLHRFVAFTKAELSVINVVDPAEVIGPEALESKRVLQESLADLSPTYFEPAFENVFEAIDAYTQSARIDLLVVLPTRHGLWYRIFQQTHTRGLVYLNHIPVLSLHQE
ncbi:MAG TPA: universal stress protein [Chitinophagaceae bacterium]|nr:universal stress protein [Chitinophagaceae bacterium]